MSAAEELAPCPSVENPLRGTGRPEGGRYRVGGKIVTSASQIVKRWPGVDTFEGATRWACGVMQDQILKAFDEGAHYDDAVKRARWEAPAVGQALADVGTSIHSLIEADLWGEADESMLWAEMLQHDSVGAEMVLNGWRAWCEWRDDTMTQLGLRTVATEWAITDEGMRIGGTLDWLTAHRDGELEVADIKPGRIRRKHLLQTYIYALLVERALGVRVGGVRVLGVPRDGTPVVTEAHAFRDEHREIARMLVHLDRSAADAFRSASHIS